LKGRQKKRQEKKKDDEDDVSSYWMNLRKREDTENI
jgi:hypothetical protein